MPVIFNIFNILYSTDKALFQFFIFTNNNVFYSIIRFIHFSSPIQSETLLWSRHTWIYFCNVIHPNYNYIEEYCPNLSIEIPVFSSWSLFFSSFICSTNIYGVPEIQSPPQTKRIVFGRKTSITNQILLLKAFAFASFHVGLTFKNTLCFLCVQHMNPCGMPQVCSYLGLLLYLSFTCFGRSLSVS